MSRDLTSWIPLIATVITVTVMLIISLIGNREFRANVAKGLTWFKLRIIKERFFYSVYIPLLVVVLVVLKLMQCLNLIGGLTAYSLWITLWAWAIRRRKKDLSAIASCRLGDDDSEKGENGLIYVRHEDGDAVKEIVHDELVRRTDVEKRQFYIYFAFRHDVAALFRRAPSVVITVEYLDCLVEAETYSFSIQYDSTDQRHANHRFKTANIVSFSGTNTWQLATFHIPDAAFRRRQQGKADFRIKCRIRTGDLTRSEIIRKGINLFVRRVLAVALNE